MCETDRTFSKFLRCLVTDEVMEEKHLNLWLPGKLFVNVKSNASVQPTSVCFPLLR